MNKNSQSIFLYEIALEYINGSFCQENFTSYYRITIIIDEEW